MTDIDAEHWITHEIVSIKRRTSTWQLIRSCHDVRFRNFLFCVKSTRDAKETKINNGAHAITINNRARSPQKMKSISLRFHAHNICYVRNMLKEIPLIFFSFWHWNFSRNESPKSFIPRECLRSAFSSMFSQLHQLQFKIFLHSA